MANLRDIRNRIASVRNTQQVTRAMKMVAAAKLRRAQEAIFITRPYAFKIREMIQHVREHVGTIEHPLFHVRSEVNHVLVVVVTADRGLAGAFNSNIIKAAEQFINDNYASHKAKGTLFLLCIGRKGHEHFAKRGYQLVGDYRGFFNDVKFSRAADMVNTIVEGFEERKWDEVHIVYNEFRNTISQNRIVEPVLPIPVSEFLTPIMEKSVARRNVLKEGVAVDYIFEPDPESIVEELVPRYLRYQFWRILLESNAAEQGARMAAMDNATTNAGELLKALRLKYNRARQAAITTEIMEIVSGAEALEQ